MNEAFDQLITQYETGEISRRELIVAIVGAAGVAGVTSAAPVQDPGVAFTCDNPDRSVTHVLLERLANMRFNVTDNGGIEVCPYPLIFPEVGDDHKNWFFARGSGLLSTNKPAIRTRLEERLNYSVGPHEGAVGFDERAHGDRVYKVGVANHDLEMRDGDLVYKVMKTKFAVVEHHGFEHGRDAVISALESWKTGSCIADECKGEFQAKLDKLKSLQPIGVLTSHAW